MHSNAFNIRASSVWVSRLNPYKVTMYVQKPPCSPSSPHHGPVLGDQYAFAAEHRGIDHTHYLLWVQDTLELIAQKGDTRTPTRDTVGVHGGHEELADEARDS